MEEAKIQELEAKINKIQGEITDLENKISNDELDKLKAELEELNDLAIWCTIDSNNYGEEIIKKLAEGEEILQTEIFEKALMLSDARKDIKNMVASCQTHEERMQKRSKWLNRHMMSMDNITEIESCACATFKECPMNEKKMKNRRDLIDELVKIGGICLTIGAMQMWVNSKGQQNPTHSIQIMIPIIMGGLVLLTLRCLLIVQPNEPSIKLKYLEKISRVLLIVIYFIGLIMISYISLLEGKPLADLAINLI